jgi:hypothetical protein
MNYAPGAYGQIDCAEIPGRVLFDDDWCNVDAFLMVPVLLADAAR